MKEKLEFAGTYTLGKRHATDRVTGSVTVCVTLHLPERRYLDELLQSTAVTAVTPASGTSEASSGSSGSRSHSSRYRRERVSSPVDPLQWSPLPPAARTAAECLPPRPFISSDSHTAVGSPSVDTSHMGHITTTKSESAAATVAVHSRFTSPPPTSSSSSSSSSSITASGIPSPHSEGNLSAATVVHESSMYSPSGQRSIRPLTQSTSPAVVHKRSSTAVSHTNSRHTRMAQLDSVMESLSLIENSINLLGTDHLGDATRPVALKQSYLPITEGTDPPQFMNSIRSNSSSSSSCYDHNSKIKQLESVSAEASSATIISSNTAIREGAVNIPTHILMSQSVRVVSKSSFHTSLDAPAASAVTAAAPAGGASSVPTISAAFSPQRRPATASAAVMVKSPAGDIQSSPVTNRLAYRSPTTSATYTNTTTAPAVVTTTAAVSAGIDMTNDTTDNLDVKSRLARLKAVTADLLLTTSATHTTHVEGGSSATPPSTATVCYSAPRPRRRNLIRNKGDILLRSESESTHLIVTSPLKPCE